MKNKFRFVSASLLVFCSYFYWDFFSIEQTIKNSSGLATLMDDGQAKFPLHRYFIAATFFIVFLNLRSILESAKKNKLLLTLVFYALISCIWAFDKEYGLRIFTLLLSAYLVSIVAAKAYTDNSTRFVKYLFWLFSFLVVASAFVALKYPQYGIAERGFGRPRWIGVTGHPNKLGVLGLVSAWTSINLYYIARKFYEKILAITALILAFLVIKGADSITSLFAAFAVAGYTFYNYWAVSKSTGVKVVFIGAAALTMLATITFYMSASDIVGATLKASGRNATLTGRSIQWALAWESIKENPLFGLGFDDLKLLTKKTKVLMSYIHNGYLSLLVRGGGIAGLLFIILISKTVLRFLVIKKNDARSFILFSSGLLGILIYNIAEASIMIDLSALNILMFFIMITSNEVSEKREFHTKSNTKDDIPFPNIVGSRALI